LQAIEHNLQNTDCRRAYGIAYAICNFVSIDQLIAKLQKLSQQVEKGMSKQGFTVWTAMIREDLYKISNAQVRKRALKLLGVVECAGFCLEKVPEARESLILPNLQPLIEYLKNTDSKNPDQSPTTPNAPLPETAALAHAVVDDGQLGFNPS
jgi:hypothetical protein